MNGHSHFQHETASARTKAIAEVGAVFFGSLCVLLDQMVLEHQALISRNAERNDPDYRALESEWISIMAVVNAASDSTREAWVRLNSKPLTPAPSTAPEHTA